MTKQANNVLDFFGTKGCPRCRQVKPLDEFSKSTKDGLQSYCKPCNSQQGLEKYYRDNPDRRRDRRIDFVNKTRQCTKCEEWKPWDKFSTNGGRKPYPHSRCNVCTLEMHRQKKRNNPALYAANQRRNDLKTKYGITVDQYEEMLKSQGYCCKICLSKTSGRKSGVFLVDHDHNTGNVRALLCARCNVGLGNFDEDIERLRRVILYIETEGKTT